MAGQTFAVALVEPAGQKKPAAHAPEHADELRPATAPYRPASQGPEQAAVERPRVAPYLPAGHGACAAFVEPARQKEPTAQAPEHADVLRLLADP